MESFSAVEARRIALRAQGFGLRPAGPATTADLQRVIDHVNVVQIDSVNVLERSHYLPFFARVGPYDKKALDSYCYDDRQMFEYWAHMASFSPIGQYPLLRHRMEGEGWWRTTPANSEAVLEEVRLRGPLTVGQLEDGGRRSGHWWGWSQGKSALEFLFSRGLVAVSGRKNFARLYDVPERVIPAEVLALPPIPTHEAQREMLRIGARAHGIGTARDIADYFRIKITIARPRLRELVDSGELIPVRVEGWEEEAYVPPAVAPPAPIHARALLSPFDSLVWDRARDLRLFNFHYRIEIYTPSPKRTFGYYVLPFLLGD
ncbi:MAG: crosslink repair DNA glycosylase YcaQ family protein, partial [Dehalococcoidia bacterium]